MNMYAISTLLRCSKRSAMQKNTNKQTYNSKTDQSNASINKWDLRLVLKVSNLWPNLECVVLLWILQECIETNYYIKDLGNNAVCERAEAYQSTACSRIFSSFLSHPFLFTDFLSFFLFLSFFFLPSFLHPFLSFFLSSIPPSFLLTLYRVSQKKRNGGFSVHCELKVLYIFTSVDKASSAEENDT